MKFKMRVLHYAPSGNADNFAAAIARSVQTNCDQIPPAYNCEKEKLVFLCLETGKKVADPVKTFVGYLKDTSARNLAFLTISSSSPEAAKAAIAPLMEMARKNNINIIDDVYHCTVKKGLFKQGKASQKDIDDAVVWANKIVDSL